MSASAAGEGGLASAAHRSPIPTEGASGFSRADLMAVVTALPAPGVSIFLPTHVRGREVRQGPIRLGNLVRSARQLLLSAGTPPSETDAILAPAVRLSEDESFWRHQDHGLALFLDTTGVRVFRVPLSLAEQVMVGARFRIRPLLPLLAADGRFQVLTATAGKVRLFQASRNDIREVHSHLLPESLDTEMGPPDYENPVQASPVARPHTGSTDISNAQVYGDSPAEWTKARLVKFTRRVAAAVDAHRAADPVPLVLVAGAEIGGHFKAATTMGSSLAGVVETNPDAMDDGQLHEAAYSIVQPVLDADRKDAIARFEALAATGDARAATDPQEVVEAAQQGRVETVLLPVEDRTLGDNESNPDPRSTTNPLVDGVPWPGWEAQDLDEVAAAQTLLHGGRLHLLDDHDPVPPIGAILRY